MGCLADDFTGATDVAAGLRRVGLQVLLLIGTPIKKMALPDCDAIVVALKSRTIPAAEAIEQSLRAQRWLADHGVTRFYFKYCSTFDSTDAGNIGLVTDALLDAVGGAPAIICPASPEHGRTVYQGHLFVGSQLLSESSMAHHPLTPMTDPDLVRVLARQTPHPVAALPLQQLRSGPDAVRAALQQATEAGVRHLITDIADDTDLAALAAAVADRPLLTGGAGLARALGAHLRSTAARAATEDHLPAGPALVLAGSCSTATLEQVARAREVMPAHQLDPALTPDPHQLLTRAQDWLHKHRSEPAVLIYASAPADARAAGQAAMGPDTATVLETTLATLANNAREAGRRRIIVAGGETSGAVVKALSLRSLLVGPEADPGVPWCHTTTEPHLALLLKSGNFGRPDLLVRAVEGATP
ncbi:3-oxo-tetronate kinase [Klenkia soli]|uniref:3-oxo-tetronate kinase n=1 Tax=Klenkia soli TaxID=1052260 RepID=UPI001A97835B|nr:3-oxo-tetronate kinase [Klenkia soli]